MADAHKNFATSLVATAPSPAASGTSLVVTAADGAKYPTPPFNATIWPVGVQPTTANSEIVRVTAISTDTFTIVRQQESTSARTVIVGDQISANITAKTLTDAEKVVTGAVGGVLNTASSYVAIDTLEISATDSLELAAVATLEIFGFLTSVNLRNDQIFEPCKFSVYRNGALTSNNSSTFTKVTFDTKIFDTGSDFDVVTNNRFVARRSGYYWLSAKITFNVAVTQIYYAAMYKNGVALRTSNENFSTASGTTFYGPIVEGLVYLDAGDYIEIYSFAGGVAAAFLVGATSTYFDGFLVSAT